jgi:hypothetical protein
MPSFIVLIPLGFIWVGWLVCYYIFIFLLYFYMYACIVKIYIFFSCFYYVKHDSYFGVLMAYGGLQDVRRSHHISLINGELLLN